MKGYRAICLWPIIIMKDRQDTKSKALINHERIHFRQQLELLVVFFYFVYLFEYLYCRTIKGQNHKDAYHNISFEKEAYDHENDLNYLNERLWFGQWR